MNPIPIFNSVEVAEINTGERWMLINHIKQLVLSLPSINVVIPKSKSNDPIVLMQTFNQIVESNCQIIK